MRRSATSASGRVDRMSTSQAATMFRLTASARGHAQRRFLGSDFPPPGSMTSSLAFTSRSDPVRSTVFSSARGMLPESRFW